MEEIVENIDSNEKLKNMSFSRIDLYNTGCPFRYKLRYEDKHYVNSSGLAADFGTLVHFIEQTIADDIKANDNEPYFLIDNEKYPKLFMEGYKSDNEEDKTVLGWNDLQLKYEKGKFLELDKHKLSYSKKKNIYLESGIGRLQEYLHDNPNLIILDTEKEFNWSFRGYNFHGFIDRVLKDVNTGEIIIEDIKTWSDVGNHDLTTPLQFVIYCSAAKELYQQDVSTCYYDLPIVGARYKAGTKGFIKRGLTKLNKLLDSIEASIFDPKPSNLCYWCEFSETNPEQPEEAKNLCPYFSHYTKDRSWDHTVENEWIDMDTHEEVLEGWLKQKQKKLDRIMNNPLYKNVLFPKIDVQIDSNRRKMLRR